MEPVSLAKPQGFHHARNVADETATGSLEAGPTQLCHQARERASQDARELVERFGQKGRRKLQTAGWAA